MPCGLAKKCRWRGKNISAGWRGVLAAAVYSFSDLLDIVKTEPHLLNIFVVTAWKLWNLRNKIRAGETVIPIETEADFA